MLHTTSTVSPLAYIGPSNTGIQSQYVLGVDVITNADNFQMVAASQYCKSLALYLL